PSSSGAFPTGPLPLDDSRRCCRFHGRKDIDFSVFHTVGDNRIVLMISSSTYALYCAASVRVYIVTYLGASVLIGIGAAALWTAQASYLTRMSKPSTLGRHNGVVRRSAAFIFFVRWPCDNRPACAVLCAVFHQRCARANLLRRLS